MRRERTLQEYRTIDLILWGMMLVLFECIIVTVARSGLFRDANFTVSLAGAITSIVYMRWGWWGGIHAALAGVLFVFYCGGGPGDYLVFGLGNLASLAGVPLLKKVGAEKVRQGKYLSLLFPLAVVGLMELGRGATALAVGYGPEGAVRLVASDSLSVVFTVVIVWIARRLDGVYEEQKHYLLRLQEEKE